MILRGSIYRKLAIILMIVLGILIVQAISGLSGLLSYRQVIHTLDRALTAAPQRSHVILALAQVHEPLLWPPLKTEQGLLIRQRALRERLMAVGQALREYYRRIESDRLHDDARLPTVAMLHSMDHEVAQLLRDQVPLLTDPLQSERAAEVIRDRVAALQLSAVRLPYPEKIVDIQQAREDYRRYGIFIVLSTVGAAALLVLAIHLAYRWIVKPIRILHEGASRVAQGDFGYRVELAGHDEMAQLAAKFNTMTARFQQIKDQLDQEVQARSRQLIRSERLASVGFLAAGIAHEINNPLSAIAMAAESLEMRMQRAREAPQEISAAEWDTWLSYVQMMQREAFRCQQITRRLLDFSRGQDGVMTPQDLTRIVSEVLDMVSHMSRYHGHEIVFDRTKSVIWVVNGPQIKQVVLNLVANALESMEGAGRLEITITEHADEVVLKFKDTGCGMTPYVMENLFEPFFTEKKSGRGTGLGLSISHRIVTDHGGRIEAFSEGPGRGSVFCVHLPRRTAQEQAA